MGFIKNSFGESRLLYENEEIPLSRSNYFLSLSNDLWPTGK